jgi:hypothetical protein
MNKIEDGIAAAATTNGDTPFTAGVAVSLALSGATKVLADFNATDGQRYQIRETSGGELEFWNQTNSTVLMRITSVGRMFVDPSSAATPTLSLTIGDTDTGIDWISDGRIQIKANNTAVMDIQSGQVNSLVTLQQQGNQVIYNGGGSSGRIYVQSSAPVSPVTGDTWFDTSINLG